MLLAPGQLLCPTPLPLSASACRNASRGIMSITRYPFASPLANRNAGCARWLNQHSHRQGGCLWHRPPTAAPRQPTHWHAERKARNLARTAAAAEAKARESVVAPLALPADFVQVSADGRWRVRPINRDNMDELRRVVLLQANAFYEGGPLPVLDGLFKQFFVAEVLSEMQKKVKFNPADRFVLLVAEHGDDSSSNTSKLAPANDIIGVVEVSYLNEKEVLQSLGPEAQVFAYVASMAVDAAWHRRGVATALLQAAEHVAEVWEEPQPLLHVYQDNLPAIQLYQRNGYGVIFQDAGWWARLGVRPRYLMRKLQGEA